MLESEYVIAGLATILLIGLCVVVHYEGLRFLSDRLPVPRVHHRRRIVLLITSLLLLHIIEIWIFGIGYFVLLQFDGFGSLMGQPVTSIVDFVYYSAAVYTTVGFGDIYPVGAIRTMTGMEAVTGLTIITWSASYTFLEMLKTWNHNDGG